MNDINNQTIQMYSVGLFGSWCFHKYTKTLFDCGDGASQVLRKGIFKINRIMIGHPHLDHIVGLISLIGLKNIAAGSAVNNNRPLEIWGDLDNPMMAKFIRIIKELHPIDQLKYKLTFNDIKPGQRIDVGSRCYIKAFKMSHSSEYGSIGFCVYRESKGLKPGIDPSTVQKRIQSGEIKQADIMEQRDKKLFAYTLDNSGFDIEEIRGVSEVVLDCTFLNEEDRGEKTHASLRECNEILKEIKCDYAYLAHISPRYEIASRDLLVWNHFSGYWLGGRNLTFEELSKQISRIPEKD